MSDLSERAAAWLEARGLDVELATRLGVSSEGSGSGEAIAFGYIWNGQRINAKRRTLDGKKFWQDADREQVLWNADVLADDSLLNYPLVICEGEPDGLATVQAGFPRTVSVPDGAPQKRLQPGEDHGARYQWIDTHRDLLKTDRVPEIILATDGDQNGINLMHDLSQFLGRARCRWVRYPKGEIAGKPVKDANDVLRKWGAARWKSVLEEASWLAMDGLYRQSELPPEPELTVLRSGISADLDRHLGLCLGHLSAWTGIPNMGKSSAALAVHLEIARRYGLGVAHWSPEHGLSQQTSDLRRYLRGGGMIELEIDQWVEKHWSFLRPRDDRKFHVDALLDLMEAAVTRHRVKMFLLDPWNEVEHEVPRHQSFTDYTNDKLREFARFARTLDCHVAWVAHPTKQQKNKDGTFNPPTLYDISGSSNWFNKVHNGIVVHREPRDVGDGNVSLVRVEKSKIHRLMGPPGDALLEHDRETGRYQGFSNYERGGRLVEDEEVLF